MGLVVLDASVVLASLTIDDPLHHPVVATLGRHAEGNLVLPASAYSESLVHAARQGRFDDARRLIFGLVDVIQAVDAAVAERSAHLRAAHRALRLPDALILATGDVMAADVVLTCDGRWSAWSERVEVVRPGAPAG